MVKYVHIYTTYDSMHTIMHTIQNGWQSYVASRKQHLRKLLWIIVIANVTTNYSETDFL